MTGARPPLPRRDRLRRPRLSAGVLPRSPPRARRPRRLHVPDGSGMPGPAPALPTALLTAAIAVPLVWRRRWPLGVLVAVVLAVVVPRAFAQIALPQLGGLGALVFALYSAGHWADRPKDLLALLVPAAGLAALTVEIPHFTSYGPYGFGVPALLIGWLVGEGMRRWQRLNVRLRRALDELGATEQVRAAAAVEEERARIARELHDVVAHAVSVMVVQAGSARLGMAEDPEASAAANRTVEETGRQALVEMRHMLGLLRAVDATPSLTPQPTLRSVAALADTARAAGQPVDLRIEGMPAPLPPGLDLSAFRIVQEALTNAFSHAGPVPVEVRIRYGTTELSLDVRNGAPEAPGTRPPDATGHGLVGMRERAELFGGRFEAGRTADGGFAVRAVLPLPEGSAGAAPAEQLGQVLA